MEAILSVKSGKQSGRSFPVGNAATVGSSPACDIRLRDGRLAERHFTVSRSGVGYVLKDGGSAPGTYVDGRRVEESPLGNRTTIYAGDLVFYFRILDEEQAAAETGGDEDGLEGDVRRIYESSVISMVDEARPPLLDKDDPPAASPLEAVYRIGRILSSDESLERMLQRTVEIVGDVLGAERCLLVLHDQGSGSWRTAAARPRDQLTVPLPTAVLNEALRSSMSLLVRDADRDDRFRDLAGVRSIVCAPLIAHRRTLGVLWADVRREGLQFTEDHLKLLTAIGRQAGGGIERRMLEAELWEHSQTLEARVANRTRELEATLDSLARTQSRLVHSEKLAAVGLMASGIAHNLSTPVAAIKGYAQILAARHPALEEAGKVLAIAERLEGIVDTLLARGRREARTDPVDVDVNDLVRDTLAFFEGDLFFKHEVRSLFEPGEGLPPIRGVYSDFSQALVNLVRNALDALRGHGGERVIRVATGLEDGGLSIAVTDSGPGVPAHVRPKLFTPFFTTKARGEGEEGPAGTGLGLYASQQLLAPYGGRIEFQVREGGATFRIVVPARDGGGGP